MDPERELRNIAGAEAEESFDRVAAWLRDASAAQKAPRRRWVPAVAIVMLALFLVGAIPVERSEAIGQILRWRVANGRNAWRQLDAQPWSGAAMRFEERSRGNSATRDAVLLLVFPNASEKTARGWASELQRLPGTRVVERRPLMRSVRGPLGVVLAKELVGLHFGEQVPEAETERRVAAIVRALPAGTIAIKHEAASGGTDLLLMPPAPDGSPTDVVASREKAGDDIVLVVVTRRPGGSSETVEIRLSARELAPLSDEERTTRVRAELKRRGIHDVDVVWENGALRVRTDVK
ncbi:MAG TPA: hypothetical protein VF551_09225 [Chthoniobacterales bacterium]|jgi:hypothetical protein